MSNLQITKEYKTWIAELKNRFRQARVKAAARVNTALIEYYWELGRDIVEKQKKTAWGSGFLKQLSSDLMREFPDVKGFSYRNLKFIRQWYSFYHKSEGKGKQAVSPERKRLLSKKGKQLVSLLAQIPWGIISASYKCAIM